LFLIGVGLTCFIAAFFLYYVTWIYPVFRVVFFDWIAFFIMVIPFIMILYRLKVTDCYHQADKIPKWKHLINYLRRDNEIIPVVGTHAFPGESFLEIPELGLMEFLGKDCVYTWGDKKVIWGLENLNYSPDPRFFNLTHLLWELGFRNSDDVKNVINGDDIQLMGEVYLNMLEYDNNHGAKKLVKEIKEYDGKPVVFKPYKKQLTVGEKVDQLFMRKIK